MSSRNMLALAGMISVLGLYGCNESELFVTDASTCDPSFVPQCISDTDLFYCDNGVWATKTCDVCIDNECKTTTPQTDCTEDVCDGNTNIRHCNGGKLGASESCGENKVCSGGICGDAPVSGEDCQADRCDADGKILKCVDGHLADAAACPDEGTCVNNKCEAKPECTTNADCTDATKPVCDQGTCVAEQAPECTTNADCTDSTKPVCDQGTCVAEQAPECTTNADCTNAGKPVCSNGTCVAGSSNPTEEVCGELTITGSDACEMTGSGSKIVLRGKILTPDKVYVGGSVVINGNKIESVGCINDIADATVITCPDAVVSPGLINAHDHLGYSNQRPDKSVGEERYAHRHDWRTAPKSQFTCHNSNTSNNNEAVEMRQLMSGTTSIFGSEEVSKLARNIDKDSIGGHVAKYDTFPLGDSGGTTATSGCSKYSYSKKLTGLKETDAYGPHIGEGINAAAVNEFRCLNGEQDDSKDIFTDRLAVIHGVAATPSIIQQMAIAGSSLIWSPRSNVSLYGDTAQTPMYDAFGVNIALGTDWISSGSMNMLRELQCADFLNEYYYHKHFSEYDLWMMATANGAKAFGLKGVIGTLEKNALADIVIFREKDNAKLHRAVIDAQPQDVLLVMLDGKTVFGDANIVSTSDCEEVNVCGSTKKACPKVTGSKYSFTELRQMTTNAGKIKRCNKKFSYCDDMINANYDLFFCGTPEDEPTCVPFRTRAVDTTSLNSSAYSSCAHDSGVNEGLYCDANDRDGDGVPDAEDNCKDVFNPIRPMDNGKQADSDGDGKGDACDSYPLCIANDSTCPTYDPKVTDTDGDTIPDRDDKCPTVADPENADTDNDNFGDACEPDGCVGQPDEDGRGCALAITSLKSLRDAYVADTITYGAVKVEGIVTGIAQQYNKSKLNGFFIQDPDYPAGVYVYSTEEAGNVKIGDKVTVKGTTSDFKSLLEITPTSVEKTGTGTVTPKTLTAAETIQGTTAEKGRNPYDSALVHVAGLKVVNYDEGPEGSAAGYAAFACVDGSNNASYIDDFIMGTDDLKAAVKPGITYDVTGVLVYDYNRSKIAPRSADDLIAGFGVMGLTPAAATAEYGDTVKVTLNMTQAAESYTNVAISCTPATAECPASVTVGEGNSSVEFDVKVGSADKTVVTATYEGSSVTTEIAGIDPSTPLSVSSVDPATAKIKNGESQTVAVTLNKPAKGTDNMLKITSSNSDVIVPATVAISDGATSASFDITVASTAVAGTSADITVAVGSTEAKTITVTVLDAGAFGNTYNLNFKDQTGSGYSSSYTTHTALLNGMVATGVGQFAADGDYADDMVMTGNSKGNYLEITGLDGVGKITLDVRGYATNGKLNVIVGSDSRTLDMPASGTTDTKEVVFDDSEATSFRIEPPTDGCSANACNRVGLTKVTWTTNK